MTECPIFQSCGTRLILRSLVTLFQPEIILKMSALDELDSSTLKTYFLVQQVPKQKSRYGSVGGLGPRSCLVLDQCLVWCWVFCPTFSDEFCLWSVLWKAKTLTYVSFCSSSSWIFIYSINTKLSEWHTTKYWFYNFISSYSKLHLQSMYTFIFLLNFFLQNPMFFPHILESNENVMSLKVIFKFRQQSLVLIQKFTNEIWGLCCSYSETFGTLTSVKALDFIC